MNIAKALIGRASCVLALMAVGVGAGIGLSRPEEASAGAVNLKVLYSFSGSTDGSYPMGSVVQATNGEFYGTTSDGGADCCSGTIFKITPSGTFTTIHSFCTQGDCSDGLDSRAGLVQAKNGYLYGTTWYGGSAGDGTVFKIAPNGMLTTIYNFCPPQITSCLLLIRLFQQATSGSGQPSDGGSPRSDAPRISSYLVGLCPAPSPSSVWNAAIGVFRRL